MGIEKQTLAGTRAKTEALLTLVIPTRNEADNVPRLVHDLKESLLGVDYRVVFVDESTDQTPEVIRSLREEDDRIVLIHREGSERDGGLSTAVTAGMNAAASDSGLDLLPENGVRPRWSSSLAVPVIAGDQPIGVVYATRNLTEHFIEEDLHWLTAYASTSCHIFYQ